MFDAEKINMFLKKIRAERIVTQPKQYWNSLAESQGRTTEIVARSIEITLIIFVVSFVGTIFNKFAAPIGSLAVLIVVLWGFALISRLFWFTFLTPRS